MENLIFRYSDCYSPMVEKLLRMVINGNICKYGLIKHTKNPSLASEVSPHRCFVVL